MNKTLLSCLTIVILFLGWSCNPDDDAAVNPTTPIVSDAEFAKNFGNAVQRDFIGQIVDINNDAIVGAS
jgi:hypothetical protein